MNPKHSVRLLGPGLGLVACLVVMPMAQASPWAKVATATPGPAAAIGGLANGCIAGARALPATGPSAGEGVQRGACPTRFE